MSNSNQFEWTDELVKEFHDFYKAYPDNMYLKINKVLSDFKKHKQPPVKESTVEDKCVFDVVAIKKIIEELKDCKWVKSKSNGILRYVTKKVNEDIFEDDGLISGQPPSHFCHYDNYEDLTKDEEISAWCGYMARQPLQFYSPSKRYSQEEVDTIRKETQILTWKAARYLSERDYHHIPYKFNSMQDYLNSLPKEQSQQVEVKEDTKVLFTTNGDKVEMRLGDSYWFIDERYKLYGIKVCSTHDINKGMINFSTKEAAEQYILNNKPCLSLQEVLQFVDAASHPSEENFREHELREYLKQKLKQ